MFLRHDRLKFPVKDLLTGTCTLLLLAATLLHYALYLIHVTIHPSRRRNAALSVMAGDVIDFTVAPFRRYSYASTFLRSVFLRWQYFFAREHTRTLHIVAIFTRANISRECQEILLFKVSSFWKKTRQLEKNKQDSFNGGGGVQENPIWVQEFTIHILSAERKIGALCYIDAISVINVIDLRSSRVPLD